MVLFENWVVVLGGVLPEKWLEDWLANKIGGLN